MNNPTLGAIIRFDNNGNITQLDVIANSDKEATMVQQKLEALTKPSGWARLKRLFPGG
jgi:hypothetical protein